jgi:hypothetical protein
MVSTAIRAIPFPSISSPPSSSALLFILFCVMGPLLTCSVFFRHSFAAFACIFPNFNLKPKFENAVCSHRQWRSLERFGSTLSCSTPPYPLRHATYISISVVLGIRNDKIHSFNIGEIALFVLSRHLTLGRRHCLERGGCRARSWYSGACDRY